MDAVIESILNYGAIGAVLVYFIYKDLAVNRKLIEHLHEMLDEIKDMVKIIKFQLDIDIKNGGKHE